MSRLPSVLFHSDLPEAELHAAKLDGELYAVDSCFSPIDQIDGPLPRALALALTVPDRLIAEQWSAAWIYGVRARPPRIHQLCADIAARVRPPSLVAIAVREVVIEPGDLLQIGGLRLTAPVRTIVDLARNSVDFDRKDLMALGDLMRFGGVGAAECRAVLDRRRNLPHKRLAIARIDEAVRLLEAVRTGQPPLTR